MNAVNDARISQSKSMSVEGQTTWNSIWDSAIMRSLEAQMLAVKAITWKY